MNLGEDTILNNRYRILRVLSDKGGMGMIYQARDLKFEQTVVIKQLRFTSVEALRQDKQYGKQSEQELREVAESMQQAFEREAKLLFGLHHKALPRVFDRFQTADDDQCLVMEFIEGQDFDDLLRQHGSFPLDRVLDWAEQLLDALHYLHTEFPEPIVHRDINPRNLKLTPKGQVVLLDFGLAKGALSGMSVAGSVWGGSNDYAPIEQIDPAENERQKSDPRSDLYSLAVTLYHLLSGWKPAPAVSRVNAKARGAADPLRPLKELVSHVPTPVATVLQNAAAVYAKDRLATATEMRQLLRQAVTSTPLSKITPRIEPEMETVVRPRRSIVISLSPKDEGPKPMVEAKPTQQQSFSEDLGNGVKLEMVYIPGGSFLIGSHYGENYDEKYPQRLVTLAPFYIGKHPVTQAQWETMMVNPSHFIGDNLPVENLSWDEAVMFCDMVSKRTGKNYRLPTEFEWEHACRAGSNGKYGFGDDESLLGEYAWYDRNSGGRPHPVGQKKPNAWGLFDMHGNVEEWCEYDSGLQNGWLVPHGGCWGSSAGVCAMTFRTGLQTHRRLNVVGFRVVMT